MSSSIGGTPREELPMLVAPELLDGRNLTVADVANLPEDLHYELINGRLVLSPSATPFHQYASAELLVALRRGCPRDLMVTFDQSVMVDGQNEPRPDLVVIEKSGAGGSPVLAADVLLAVEVVSRESVTRDLRDKQKLYAYGGIPSYWLLDPLGVRVTFTQFLLGDGGVYHRHLHADDVVTVDVPWEVTIDLPALTRERDDLCRRAGRSAV